MINLLVQKVLYLFYIKIMNITVDNSARHQPYRFQEALSLDCIQ
jgi:hypothetical protein